MSLKSEDKYVSDEYHKTKNVWMIFTGVRCKTLAYFLAPIAVSAKVWYENDRCKISARSEIGKLRLIDLVAYPLQGEQKFDS